MEFTVVLAERENYDATASVRGASQSDDIVGGIGSKRITENIVCGNCGIRRHAQDDNEAICCRGTFSPGLHFKCSSCGKREEDHEQHENVLLCPEWLNRFGDDFKPEEEFVMELVDQSRRADIDEGKKKRLAEDEAVRERAAFDFAEMMEERYTEAVEEAAKEELRSQKRIQALDSGDLDSSSLHEDISPASTDSFHSLFAEYERGTTLKKIRMPADRANKEANEAKKILEKACEDAAERKASAEEAQRRASETKAEAERLRAEKVRVVSAFERNQQAIACASCCFCRKIARKGACKHCLNRSHAFTNLIERLEKAIEDDAWLAALLILQEANSWTAPALKPVVDQLWKLCLLCASGVRWLHESAFSFVHTGHLDASWTLPANPWLSIDFKHLKVALSPSIAALDGFLTSIDLSHFPHLEKLPVKDISSMASLASLSCRGCPNLVSPPPEVAAQGGVAVMDFLREAERDGLLNTDMLLFLIGDAEAGKTSTIRALMHGRAPPVSLDRRTVGIDVSHWDPDPDLNFRVLDLAGQKVYTVTHKFFLAQRAVYLLVWRASPLEEQAEGGWMERQKDMISRWLDLLQCRVPGTPVMLVVTHTDPELVSQADLEQQCQVVKEAVLKRLKAHQEADKVAPLRIVNGGDSIRIDCLTGAGVQELRDKVVSAAKGVRWYAEALPSSWVRLQRRVEEVSRSKHWLQFDEYRQIAEAVGVQGQAMLQVATKFLHETGRLKYFGSDGRGEVYVSPAWGIQIFKGIMRDSRLALFRFLQRSPADSPFKAECREQLDRQLRCLQVCGELHEHLLPFLWPGDAASTSARHHTRPHSPGSPTSSHGLGSADDVREELCVEFWMAVREAVAGSGADESFVMERESWEDVLKNEPHKGLVPGRIDAAHPAMKLLIRFHILAKLGVPALDSSIHIPEKFVVPELIGRHRGDVLDSRCYQSTDCPWWTRWGLLFVPVGFLSGLFLRIRAKATHSDQGLWGGAFYRRGGMVQVFAQHKTSEEGVTLTVRASSRERFDEAMLELEQHCAAYPGLPVTRKEAVRKAHADRMRQVVMLTANNAHASRLKTELEAMPDIGEVGVLSETESGEGARILLVLVDNEIGVKYHTKRWMAERVAALKAPGHVTCAVVPIVMPGYAIADFNRWWPASMESLLARHSLFVKVTTEAWAAKVQGELKRRIYTLLDDWRGQPPKAAITDEASAEQGHQLGPAQPAAMMMMSDEEVVCCPSCSRRGLGGRWRGNSRFNKSDLERELKVWVQRREDGRKEGLPSRRCAHGHKHDVMELLSSPLVQDAIPCPRCRTFPPFCFDRSYCFAHYVEKRHGNVKCDRCQVHIPLRQVLKPAIFVSYNWGFQGSTKKIVMPLCRRVEDKTDMLCWLDELGGMAAGDDKDAAMLSGIRDASIVLVFLSDAYLKSPACQFEFTQAVRMGKFIVPLLLPTPALDPRDQRNTDASEFGWRGKGGEAGKDEWWLHAESVLRAADGKSNRRGSQGKGWSYDEVPWWALSLFQPIDLRHEARAEGGGMLPNSRAEEEVVYRIMARIHRDSHVHYSSSPGWTRVKNAIQAVNAFKSPGPSNSTSRRSSVASSSGGSASLSIASGLGSGSVSVSAGPKQLPSPLATVYGAGPSRRRSALEAPPSIDHSYRPSSLTLGSLAPDAGLDRPQPQHGKDVRAPASSLFITSPAPPSPALHPASPSARAPKLLPASPSLSRRSSTISASGSRRSSMELSGSAAHSRRSSATSLSDGILLASRHPSPPSRRSPSPDPAAHSASWLSSPRAPALVPSATLSAPRRVSQVSHPSAGSCPNPSPPKSGRGAEGKSGGGFRAAFPSLFTGSSSLLLPAPSASLAPDTPPPDIPSPSAPHAPASARPDTASAKDASKRHPRRLWRSVSASVAVTAGGMGPAGFGAAETELPDPAPDNVRGPRGRGPRFGRGVSSGGAQRGFREQRGFRGSFGRSQSQSSASAWGGALHPAELRLKQGAGQPAQAALRSLQEAQ